MLNWPVRHPLHGQRPAVNQVLYRVHGCPRLIGLLQVASVGERTVTEVFLLE